MAYPNLEWPWLICGVNTSERCVLAVLARAANEQGYVSKYSIPGVREKIPELKRRMIQKIIASAIKKGFILDRIKRSQLGKHTVLDHHKGLQRSNAFQLDLKRRFPKDPSNPSVRLWREIITRFRAEGVKDGISRQIDELVRPEYPVWFEMDETTQRTKTEKRMISYGLLRVHCESARAADFCKKHVTRLIAIGETLSPPINNFRFTFPKF